MPRPAHALGFPCLPPFFDGGQRLHPAASPSVFWLELLLRQHELCWRKAAAADEVRIALAGSSAVHGFPLPVEESLAYHLNQTLATRRPPAHVFNVAFVNTYQLRDAVIINEALRYGPDVIVFPLTLEQFVHFAPAPFPPLYQFFRMNASATLALRAERPDGLQEPLEGYLPELEAANRRSAVMKVKEIGTLVRTLVRLSADSLATEIGVPVPSPVSAGRQTTYDCNQTERTFRFQFRRWQEWNILAWLAQLRVTRGVEVLVVNWPVAHEPVDTCYNVRYPTVALADFGKWLERETAARGLHYVDLHDVLPPDRFIDSVHVGAIGQREVAARVLDALEPVLADVAARRARGARALTPGGGPG